METNFALINDDICVNTIVSSAEFALGYAASEGYIAVPLPDGYGIGDLYDGETWTKQKSEPEISPAERRRFAYETKPIIEWENNMLTVDAATLLWSAYSIEANPKADVLAALVTQAKLEIRKMFPDEEVTI